MNRLEIVPLVQHPLHAEGALPEKLLISPEEAAKLLSVSRTRVYELIRRRELRSVRLGRVRRIPLDALRAYVAGLVEER